NMHIAFTRHKRLIMGSIVTLGIGVLIVAGVVSARLALASGATPAAKPKLIQISTDPYTNSGTQHQTQVEPDTFAFGNTIVATFQWGRGYTAGSSNIDWATSTDKGKTWTHGSLPAITGNAGGPYARVSDPAVAYDPAHHTWLIASLPV